MVEDIHLLSLYGLSSADELRTHLTLSLAPGARGCGSGALAEGGAHAQMAFASPLAREAALKMQAAWQRLTTFLGVPLRGCERDDRWLQPRSELPALLRLGRRLLAAVAGLRSQPFVIGAAERVLELG